MIFEPLDMMWCRPENINIDRGDIASVISPRSILVFFSRYIEILIWRFSYHTPYQPKTPISARGSSAFGPRADMSVSGWYGVWYENCQIIVYLSCIFLSDKFAYLISFAESKARPPSAPNVVIWGFFFAQAKKAVSPTWPGEKGFFPVQKSRITQVTHYHTFCNPQEWCVFERHG